MPSNMSRWTAALAVAVCLAVAAAAPKRDDDTCHGSNSACADRNTRVICADLGSGLIPVSRIRCPAGNPVCSKGVCGPEPSTTTTTTTPTTTTVPPDPCAGGELSCADQHTLRVCTDLGAGLIPVSELPCEQNKPLCVQGVCVAAPTAAPTTTPSRPPTTTRRPTTPRPTTPRPTTRRPTTPRPTTPPPTTPPPDCNGQVSSCVDASTVLTCADLGAGLVPVHESPCGGQTPLCRAGACVAVPTTTTPAATTSTTPAPPADVCQGKLSVCGDCYTRTTCARMGKEIVPVSNTTCAADKPYCVHGACESDLPADSSCAAIPAPESTFTCFADGYFPDAADCRRYHLCVGDKAYDYDCSQAAAGLIYDQARALCVPLGQAQCFAFDCRGRANTYQTYRPDPTLYALCVSDDVEDALLARCPAGHTLVVDPNDPLSVTCQPFCARAGRTADPDDAAQTSFYECFATTAAAGSRLVGPFKGSCPEGSVFDAASQRCQSTAPARPDSTTAITTPEPTTVTVTTTAARNRNPWWW